MDWHLFQGLGMSLISSRYATLYYNSAMLYMKHNNSKLGRKVKLVEKKQGMPSEFSL